MRQTAFLPQKSEIGLRWGHAPSPAPTPNLLTLSFSRGRELRRHGWITHRFVVEVIKMDLDSVLHLGLAQIVKTVFPASKLVKQIGGALG